MSLLKCGRYLLLGANLRLRFRYFVPLVLESQYAVSEQGPIHYIIVRTDGKVTMLLGLKNPSFVEIVHPVPNVQAPIVCYSMFSSHSSVEVLRLTRTYWTLALTWIYWTLTSKNTVDIRI